MLRSWLFRSSRGPVLAALALIFSATAVLAQTGSIEGTVRNAGTAAPLADARVTVVGSDLAAVSNQNGYFRIDNVPAGTYSVQVALLGFNAVTVTNARVQSGLPVTVNFELMPAVINLDAVVVTGVLAETQRAKLPFTVDQVKGDDLPVPQVDALGALVGKVAGATVVSGSGRPGAGPTILLRGPTSINAAGRSQEPLYVVDGVILGNASMVDLDALDIESVEVVKGAAASSLYGSRAASGVVQITTRRGRSLTEGDLRFTVRTEFGTNQLPGRFDLTQAHQFAMNEGGTKFLDGATLEECDWLDCANAPGLAGSNEWDTFQDGEWPGTTYDQVERFFEGGNFMQQYLAAEGRSGGTNFHASYSNLREEGIMQGLEGFIRNNFRINVDQELGSAFRVGASAFYSASQQDDFAESSGNTLFDLTRIPAGVDLLTLNYCRDDPCPEWQEPRMLKDELGNEYQDPNDLWLVPDPFNTESTNPLYTVRNIEDIRNRSRFLGSANVRWRPTEWVSFDGNVSYDRLDNTNQYYRFKGYKTRDVSPSTNLGGMNRNARIEEAFNWSANVTLTKRFGDLATRAQFRYLAEYDDYEYTYAGGSRFAVQDVPVLDNLDATRVEAESELRPVRADGYFGIVNFDFKDRYIVDALLRNDGSSLFGADQRRQWYYRLAGAWRVSEDIALPSVDELKIRYAYGTAGGRPRFTAQYETYDVSGGQVSPVTLGNRDLKPEFSIEQEAGLDLLMFGRLGLTLTYAQTKTEDQILEVPLLAATGFQAQWQNAGTLESKTWEATLDLQLVQTRQVSWSVRALFDRTRQKITELTVAPFTYGVSGQEMGAVFFAREGESIGTFYGAAYATSCDHLLGQWDCSEFTVNDDGLLVWVGPGGSLDNPQWGTSGPTLGFYGQNRTVMWGSPFTGWGVDELSGDTTSYLPVGKTMPDYNFGFSTTLRYGGLTLYALLERTSGISVWNQPLQWAVFKGYAGIMDQRGVPDNLKKPVGYYDQLYGVAGLRPVNYWVQDASFTKLREVSLRYRFSRAQLASAGFLRVFEGIAISVTGRNLISWDNYNGYDPETGRGGGDTGSAAIARVDGFNYPNFRTFSASLEVNF